MTAPGAPWRGLYRWGAVAAWLYIALGLVAPATLFVRNWYDRGIDGAALMQFVADNRLRWFVVQTLALGVSSVLAIVVFTALFVSLWNAGRGLAAVGSTIGVALQVLFVAYYPITLGIIFLSDHYATAAPARQAALAAAGEGLIAMIDAFNPLYESVFAFAILLLALAMLRGVYPRHVAWVGLAIPVVAAGGLALWPVLEVAYLWWWLVFVVWLVLVGLHLWRLAGEVDL